VLINAVFQEPDDHSQNSTRREASKALQNPLRDEVGVVLDLARCVEPQSRRWFEENIR